MSGFRMVSVVTVVIATALLVEECLGQGLPRVIAIAYDNAVDQRWEQLAPSTPAANAVECSFDVHMTEVIGGRCVQLGGGSAMAACQAGMYLDVDSEVCEGILAAREANEERQNMQQQNEQITPAAETGVSQPESGLSEQQQQ